MPHNARVQRCLDSYGDRSESLLIRSVCGLSKEFNRTGDKRTDLILSAFADNLQQDLIYQGELDDGLDRTEYQWCVAKLTGSNYPELVLPNEDGYALTHSIFYSTDFTRQVVNHQQSITRLMSAIVTENDKDLIAEYSLCLLATGGALVQEKLSELITWYDQDWNDGRDPHYILTSAFLFARMP